MKIRSDNKYTTHQGFRTLTLTAFHVHFDLALDVLTVVRQWKWALGIVYEIRKRAHIGQMIRQKLDCIVYGRLFCVHVVTFVGLMAIVLLLLLVIHVVVVWAGL